MSKSQTAAINSITGIANLVFTIIIGIILVPLYLQFFSLSLWGSWLASGNIITMLGVFEAGLSLILTQKLSVAKTNDGKEFITIHFNGIIVISLISVLTLALGIIILPYIPDIVKAEMIFRESLLWGLFFSLMSTVITTFTIPYLIIPQVYLKTLFPGLLNIISLLIAVIVIIIALYSDYGISSIGLGYLVKSIIIFTGNFLYSLKLLKDQKKSGYVFEFDSILNLFKEITIPFLSRLSNVLISNSQNLVIAYFLSPTITAIYDFTSKVTTTLKMLMNNLSISTFSGFTLAFSDKDRSVMKNTVEKFLLFYSVIMAFSYGFSILFSKIIITYWVGYDKFGGYKLLILIVFAAIMNDFLALSNMFSWTSGNFKKSSIFDIIYLIAYSLLVIILIKFQGVFAIPISLIIASSIVLILINRNILRKVGLTISFLADPFVKPFLAIFLTIIPFALFKFIFSKSSILIDASTILAFTLTYILLLFYFSEKHWNNLIIVIKSILVPKFEGRKKSL